MPAGLGINNVTVVTYQNITDIMNVTSYADFAVKVGWDIYGGWFWFLILWVIAIILFFKFQDKKDQPLNNAMYSGAVVTLGSFFLRAVSVTANGVTRGMITDKQMWIFPILTICFAAILWAIKDE